MKPRLRFACMDKDDLVWRKLEEVTDQWDESTNTRETYRAVALFILKYKPGQPELMHIAVKGGFNKIYRLEYKDGSSVIMRVPIKGVVELPEEKILYEVATMRYVAAHTTIPVPHIYHHGTAAENPTGIGPFIIMDWIDYDQNMSRALLDNERGIDERPVLDPKISEERLELLYGQMANILLQLSTLKFPRIGSLVQGKGDDKSTSVGARPLIANMNEILIHTNAPESTLPSQTYGSAHEWYASLSDMHMTQLAFQHNEAVEDEDDARDKYVARQLFRNLATEKRLAPGPSQTEAGDFLLFSEDFRPANVLLDKDLRVVGVIDWEFAYAAPPQFSFDPPWWLLLQEPEDWSGGYEEWIKSYEPRLQTFLRVLEAEEKKMMATTAKLADQMNESLSLSDTKQTRTAEVPLSQRMRESWQEQTWLLKYAARKSWMFDYIWWEFLDEKYHGANEDKDHKARLELLSEPQRKTMGSFVARKMEEKEKQEIVEWKDEEAASYLADLLV